MRTSACELDHPLDAFETTSDTTAAIDAWLSVVSRLMNLPESVRVEICAELREHLRERVRDLLLSGRDERDALRTAIDELGETAHLARRFEAADRPRPRRLLMHAMFTIACAGAIAAGALTLSHNNSNRTLEAARFDAHSAAAVAPPKNLADARVSLAADDSLREALETVLKLTKVGLMVNWGQLESNGVQTDQPLGVSFGDLPGPRALTLIAQAAGARENHLDWRVREKDLVEFGLRSELDRREIALVTYDVTDSINIIAGRFAGSQQEAMQQVTELLTSMVEPENWMDNGGDLAQMKIVGGRLFVQAPTRMQGRVEWILQQLPRGDAPMVSALNTSETLETMLRIATAELRKLQQQLPPDDLALHEAEARVNSLEQQLQDNRQGHPAQTGGAESSDDEALVQALRDAKSSLRTLESRFPAGSESLTKAQDRVAELALQLQASRQAQPSSTTGAK